MAYQRKTEDVYKIMWNGEEVDRLDTLKEAREMKKEYELAYHSSVSIRKGREVLYNMAKFELFMGCLGNGITVCNKAIEEHGDYKKIAHIAECGKITWYVEPNLIPGDALIRIEHEADIMNANWEKWLNDMPVMKRYETLLDAVPHIAFMHVCGNKEMSIEERISYLKNVCYQQSRF